MDASPQLLETNWCVECQARYEAEAKVCPVHGLRLVSMGQNFAPGAFIDGKYEIVEAISSGGWGTVYLSKQAEMDRLVAIKVLHKHLASDDTAQKRFLREAKALNAINHPNLARLFSFGLLPSGQPFFVMDYIKGVSLERFIEENGPLKAETAMPLFVQMCGALQAIHEAGVVHRDIKPGNIILRESGGARTATIVDFGLVSFDAKNPMHTGRLTKTGMTLGTPKTMCPEQCRGQQMDGRSDLYALGCTMYEAVTGSPAFDGRNFVELMHKQVSEDPVPPIVTSADQEVGAALSECIMHCLAKAAADRPASAAQLSEMIQDAARGIMPPPRKSRSTPPMVPLSTTPSAFIDARSSGTWGTPPPYALVTIAGILLLAAISASLLFANPRATESGNQHPNALTAPGQAGADTALMARIKAITTESSPSGDHLLFTVEPVGGHSIKTVSAPLEKFAYCLKFATVGSICYFGMDPQKKVVTAITRDAQREFPVHHAQDQVRTAYDTMATGTSAFASEMRDFIHPKLNELGDPELQILFNSSDLQPRVSDRSGLQGYNDAPYLIDSHRFQSDVTGLRLLRAQGREVVILLNCSHFYKTRKGFLKITLVPDPDSSEGSSDFDPAMDLGKQKTSLPSLYAYSGVKSYYTRWVIAAVEPATKHEWDSVLLINDASVP